MNLILASASAGRKYLLSLLNIPFTIIPSTVEEEKIVGKTPLETIMSRARIKGKDVEKKIKSRILKGEENQFLILAADSTAIFEGKLFGKPKNRKEATAILRELSGKTHQFVTAVYIIKYNFIAKDVKKSYLSSNKKVIIDTYERTLVTLRQLSDKDIKRYLNLTNYTQFAAAYSLLGSPQDFVTRVKGSISNIIGLPYEKIIPILEENKLLA